MKTLNKFIIAMVALFTLQSCIVSSSPKYNFFDNPYYDFKDTKFVSVNVPMWIAKPFIKKALREEEDGEQLVQLIKKISDVKLLVIENGNPKMLTDFSKYLSSNQYQEWMTIKKEKEIINFQAKQKGDLIKKLMITVKSGTEMVYVDISGKFTPEDISEIINYSEKNDIRKKVVSK